MPRFVLAAIGVWMLWFATQLGAPYVFATGATLRVGFIAAGALTLGAAILPRTELVPISLGAAVTVALWRAYSLWLSSTGLVGMSVWVVVAVLFFYAWPKQP